MHISADHDRIRHFVQRSLGCACPDAVFERIELARDVDAAALQLVIGERLLIRVHVVDRAEGMAQRLRRWTADGLRSRDARRLRRLRMVLAATNPEAIEAAARGLFQGIDAAPGDACLHVLQLRAVAAALGLDAAAAAVAGESTHASTLRRVLP